MQLEEEIKKAAFLTAFGLHGFLLFFFLSQLFWGLDYNPPFYVLGVILFVAIGFRIQLNI